MHRSKNLGNVWRNVLKSHINNTQDAVKDECAASCVSCETWRAVGGWWLAVEAAVVGGPDRRLINPARSDVRRDNSAPHNFNCHQTLITLITTSCYLINSNILTYFIYSISYIFTTITLNFFFVIIQTQKQNLIRELNWHSD